MSGDDETGPEAPGRFVRTRHRRFMAGLAAAEAEYRTDARYHGRLGAMLSLKAVLEYVVAAEQETRPGEQGRAMVLVAPITALMAALASLDFGKVEAIVRPSEIGNAPPVGVLDRINRAQAAASMHALMMAGDKREVAARHIARKIDGRPYAQVTTGALWQAVARWRDGLRAPSADPTALDVLKFRAFLPHAEEIKRNLPTSALRSYAERILEDQVFGGSPVPPKVGS